MSSQRLRHHIYMSYDRNSEGLRVFYTRLERTVNKLGNHHTTHTAKSMKVLYPVLLDHSAPCLDNNCTISCCCRPLDSLDAVSPVRLRACTSAPWSSKSRTMSGSPSRLPSDARCNGVDPLSFRELTSTLYLSNTRATSRLPLAAAKCSGVLPLSSRTCTSASWSSNNCATSGFPPFDALCNGVARRSSRELISVLRSR